MYGRTVAYIKRLAKQDTASTQSNQSTSTRLITVSRVQAARASYIGKESSKQLGRKLASWDFNKVLKPVGTVQSRGAPYAADSDIKHRTYDPIKTVNYTYGVGYRHVCRIKTKYVEVAQLLYVREGVYGCLTM